MYKSGTGFINVYKSGAGCLDDISLVLDVYNSGAGCI